MLEGPYKASRAARWSDTIEKIATIGMGLGGLAFLGFQAYEFYLAGAVAKCAAVSAIIAVLVSALAFGSKKIRVLAFGLLILD
jgi:hypothetical protein